jgi:hypothetical protein
MTAIYVSSNVSDFVRSLISRIHSYGGVFIFVIAGAYFETLDDAYIANRYHGGSHAGSSSGSKAPKINQLFCSWKDSKKIPISLPWGMPTDGACN